MLMIALLVMSRTTFLMALVVMTKSRAVKVMMNSSGAVEMTQFLVKKVVTS